MIKQRMTRILGFVKLNNQFIQCNSDEESLISYLETEVFFVEGLTVLWKEKYFCLKRLCKIYWRSSIRGIIVMIFRYWEASSPILWRWIVFRRSQKIWRLRWDIQYLYLTNETPRRDLVDSKKNYLDRNWRSMQIRKTIQRASQILFNKQKKGWFKNGINGDNKKKT